jgi:Uma2 family endonuclease
MYAHADWKRRRFTVEEVRSMVETGILREDEPVELLEGELVMSPPQGPEHAGTMSWLTRRLGEAYPSEYAVRPQAPLVSGDDSLPEPDVAVLRGSYREFMKRHPRADEAVLLVEVAFTSLKLDREKARIYARAGAPVYWLLDIEGRRLEVHTEPSPSGRYDVVTLYSEDKDVALPGLDVRWRVRDLLP